ncbi:unnamed protein product [Adineta ricciae]|uniref:Uncharacterized protein n=1 Tax=Adineta ricciae TaxID=249248 RepID=A0A814UDQ3_ADIRI|nr:unnamed protein product [Adineta ricciae]
MGRSKSHIMCKSDANLYSIVSIDSNNDHYTDLTTSNQGGNTISILYDDQNGTFQTLVKYKNRFSNYKQKI